MTNVYGNDARLGDWARLGDDAIERCARPAHVLMAGPRRISQSRREVNNVARMAAGLSIRSAS